MSAANLSILCEIGGSTYAISLEVFLIIDEYKSLIDSDNLSFE